MDELLSLASSIVKGKSNDQQLDQGLALILALKEQNRKIIAASEAEKERSASLRASLQHGELDTLRSELMHYQKEVQMTRSFKSVQEDALGLLPAEDFLASHPQARNLSAYEVMKARLLHEHSQRKELLKTLQQRTEYEQKVMKQCRMQQGQVDELQGRLQQLEEQAKPLQAVLSPVTPLRGCWDRTAYLLPAPLYVIYSQLVSACEALHEPCTASIEGNTSEAEAAMKTSAAGILDVPGTSAGGKDGLGIQHPLSSVSEAQLYQPHPLRVKMGILPGGQQQQLPGKGKQPLLQIVFHFLPALQIVTAHCQPQTSTPLLASLFPEDDGSGMNIEALAQLKEGSFRFSPTQPSRPYRWCQHLAGLEFVPPLPQAAPVAHDAKGPAHQQLVVTILQRVQSMVSGS